jgi:branched-subunit amino acid aminotransferase/4-amino-4-deoxychorismate lyase
VYRSLPKRSRVIAKIATVRPDSELPRNIKHTDRGSWKIEQSKHGVDELLWVNKCNQALEFSNGNIFVLREKKLLTPPLSSTFLPGIMRCAVLVFGAQVGFQMCLENIEIIPQDELYFSSSLRGLIPVSNTNNVGSDSLMEFREALWQVLPDQTFQQLVNQQFISQSLT